MSSKYAVVFSGQIKPGLSVDDVKKAILSSFKVPEKWVMGLFSGRPVVIKSCEDRETAEQYARAMAEVGAICTLRGPAAGASPKTGSTRQATACAACGTRLASTWNFCPNCGDSAPTDKLASTLPLEPISQMIQSAAPTVTAKDFDVVAAKKRRKKFRLFGLGGGFVLGFVLALGEGVGFACLIGIFFALLGYVVAEIARRFTSK